MKLTKAEKGFTCSLLIGDDRFWQSSLQQSLKSSKWWVNGCLPEADKHITDSDHGIAENINLIDYYSFHLGEKDKTQFQ